MILRSFYSKTATQEKKNYSNLTTHFAKGYNKKISCFAPFYPSYTHTYNENVYV